ncbi:MAG: V-type ATP synthase subunit B, partial [bacterium]
KYLRFADEFEQEFVTQGENENREVKETLDLGWKLLRMIPSPELKRVRDEYIEKYGNRDSEEE